MFYHPCWFLMKLIYINRGYHTLQTLTIICIKFLWDFTHIHTYRTNWTLYSLRFIFIKQYAFLFSNNSIDIIELWIMSYNSFVVSILLKSRPIRHCEDFTYVSHSFTSFLHNLYLALLIIQIIYLLLYVWEKVVVGFVKVCC